MARARTWHEQALVLDRTKLGESDLILTLLTSEGCQGQAIAKGARKPAGKLASKVQLFCELDFLIAKGKSLDIVAEAQLLEPHQCLRGDIERVSAASVACEIAKLTSFADAPDAFLYPICKRAVFACEQAQDQAHLDLVVAAYVFKVLSHQGWRPVLEHCAACGEPSISRFSVLAGGTLCESCSKDIEGAEPIDNNTVYWLSTLLNSTFDELLLVEIDQETSSLLLALAHSWASTHLDARLRAFEFMLSVTL